MKNKKQILKNAFILTSFSAFLLSYISKTENYENSFIDFSNVFADENDENF
jgi:hypothetical protein